MSNIDRKLPPSLVSNEDVIEELTKDLEFSRIQDPAPSESSFEVNVDDCGQSAFERAQDKDGKNFKNKDDVGDHFTAKETEEPDDGNESDTESVDEEALKAEDAALTDEDRAKRQTESESLKNQGNSAFKIMEYEKSLELYSEGLRLCPFSCKQERAVLYSNRAAAKMKLEKNKDAIVDCTKAITYDENYIKAYYRRAQCHELCTNLDESLADYQKIVELDPTHVEAQRSIRRLPQMIEERNEKLKTEMMTNLKSLGNMFLKPFGLSTDNFQLKQDPETKGYSVNFKQ